MAKRLLFLDAETYYDNEYSLSRMTPPEYILDDRFELIMCAVKEDDGAAYLVDGPDFPNFLREIDATNTTTITFNALFDNAIFAWKYNFIPARILCAMRMAAALRGHQLRSVSLRAVSECLGVGKKGSEIENVKGMHREDILASTLYSGFCNYALNDVELCAEIFFRLYPEFPPQELAVMDHVLRCAIEPRFDVDRVLLQEHLLDLAADKQRQLTTAGIDGGGSELRSNPKFEALLRARGVDIEYKTTATGNSAPAFAKTDEFMARLLADPDPVVQALATARLGQRSTLEESRGQRMLDISGLPWPSYCHGNMPIPLTYSAAHTHRLGGTWKINMQNLPAGRQPGQTTKLRKALRALKGETIIAADKAQIECRINAWITGQNDLLEVFRTGADPYSMLASDIFGFIVDKAVHKMERFIGKQGVLGLGFGAGADKFYNMVLREARKAGFDMVALMQVWTPSLAERVVKLYRTKHRAIVVNGWYRLDEILRTAWVGVGAPVRYGPVEIGEGYVKGPGGLTMKYNVMNTDPNVGKGLTYSYGREETHIYGAKFLENIVQFLSRIDIMDGANRLWKRGIKFMLQEHDALAFNVPTDRVEQAKLIITEELTRPPLWASDLPLKIDISSGPTYGDAK